MVKKITLNISLLLLVLLGVAACNIKEDISDCPGSIILDYSAYSSDIIGEIDSDEQVDIFIFDLEGICVENYSFTYGQLEEMGFEFSVPIEYRGYNATVWQGLDSDNYTGNRMVIGENYDNFYMRLVYDASTLSYSKVPDPLWASQLEPIDYCAKITRHRIYMTRLHTKLELNLQQKMDDGSIVDLDMKDYLVTIHAENNVYHTDYTIDCDESEEIDYNNLEEITSGKDLVCACVGTLRISPDMECMLHIESNDVEGQSIVVNGTSEIDLVDYMLLSKTDSSVSDQEFLDLNKLWQIDLLIEEDAATDGYTTVMLSINGWVVWFSNNDLN